MILRHRHGIDVGLAGNWVAANGRCRRLRASLQFADTLAVAHADDRRKIRVVPLIRRVSEGFDFPQLSDSLADASCYEIIAASAYG